MLMSNQEIFKIHRIIRDKFYGDSLAYNPKEYEARCESWAEFCDSMNIERISTIMSVIVEAKPGQIRIEDPTGSIMLIPEETARKILVLGL